MLETMREYAKSKGVVCDIKIETDEYVVYKNGEIVFKSQKAEEIGSFIDREHLYTKFG